jgi:molecular chaperone DnaK (HSP70)
MVIMMVISNLAFSQELKYDLGIVAGSQVLPVIKAGEKLPINRKKVFFTGEDNQAAAFIHIGQNKNGTVNTITRFDAYGIPHKPAGEASVEITFSLEETKELKVTVYVNGKSGSEIHGPFEIE